MLSFFKRLVHFFRRSKTHCVHVDSLGNRYYSKMVRGKERRWVVYRGNPDPSMVPAECHVWLHYTSDTILPTKSDCKVHMSNLTGTAGAYHPNKSFLREEN